MSDPLPARISRDALAAEQARLARFFQAINKHSKALDLAIEENFGGALVDAGEVRDGVERLREALPGLIEGARVWLGRHGVELG